MLTLADIAAALPDAATATEAAGVITIAIPADNVAEFTSVLLESAATAQETYNNNPANVNQQIDAFPLPAPGVPTRRDDGTYVVTYTYTVSIDAPVNLGSATPSLV